jgi:hypothetical protein
MTGNTAKCDKTHSGVRQVTSTNSIRSRLFREAVHGQLPKAGDRDDAKVLQVRSWRLKGVL